MKDSIEGANGQTTDYEKLLRMSNQGLTYSIYKTKPAFQQEKTGIPVGKWAKDMVRLVCLSKKYMKMYTTKKPNLK